MESQLLERFYKSACILSKWEFSKRLPRISDLLDEYIRLNKPYFSYIGIIFFRPSVVKHSKRTRSVQARFKHYATALVYLTTCPIYLDLVCNLSTGSFFLLLIRFVARKGKPKAIWNDNGINFIGSERQLSILKDLNQTKIENSVTNTEIT